MYNLRNDEISKSSNAPQGTREKPGRKIPLNNIVTEPNHVEIETCTWLIRAVLVNNEIQLASVKQEPITGLPMVN